MAKVGQAELLKRFKKVEFKSLHLLTSAQNVKGLFSQASLQPENSKPAQHDPNDIFISHNHQVKKKKSGNPNIKLGKQDSQGHNPTHSSAYHNQQQNQQGHGHGHSHQQHEQRQKVYKPGPFALFYKLNQGKQNKDEQVWYYKEHKDIVGPVSSYNMDKMVYYKTIQQDTKVAFKQTAKFVKFQKIKKIIQSEKQKLQDS